MKTTTNTAARTARLARLARTAGEIDREVAEKRAAGLLPSHEEGIRLLREELRKTAW